jgi:hypothetical protein
VRVVLLLACFYLPLTLACAARGAARQTSTPIPSYEALGGGHLIQKVSANGQFVTLEDGSLWEIEPSVRFQTVDWLPMAAVTVSRAQGVGPYVYELANTQDDEGALAKYVAVGSR